MNDTERYLRRATRGTWGHKRAEIREELAAHIDERVAVHRIGGLEENEAVEKALSELGEAGEVSAGMMRLHSVPTLLGSSFFLSVMVAFVVLAIPPSTAQTLQTSTIFPSPECLESTQNYPDQPSDNCFMMGETLWTNVDSLAAALEPSGIEVEKTPAGATFRFSNGETVDVSLSGSGPVTVGDQGTYSTAQGHFDFWKFIRSFNEVSDLPVRLSNLEKPELTLGDASLTIDTTAFFSDGTGFDFYSSYLYAILQDVFYPTSYLLTLSPRNNARLLEVSERISLSVKAEPEAVYGLLVKLPIENALSQVLGDERVAPNPDFVPSPFLMDIVQPEGDVLEFYSSGDIRFVNPPDFESEAEPGDAVLLKLNGGFDGAWFEIIPPEAITVN